ncbi:hypothetical protein ACOSP7_013799 [Xanthoceras sorbifolium]
MPLYDCMLLLKPTIKKEALMELVARVGKHVYTKNGVLTDLKSFGTIQLGYGIKKLDGRYFQINPPGDDVMWIPYGFLREYLCNKIKVTSMCKKVKPQGM